MDATISEDATAPEPVRLDREHLYEQAWSEPMARLAKRYGISDVALAKICRKMDVPVPPRGYWRRLETGYRPARPPLPKLRAGVRSAVDLTARPVASEVVKRSPEVEAQEEYERHRRNRIRVAKRLVDPHSLVRSTAAALHRPKSGQPAAIGAGVERRLDVRVGPKSVERALRIMDALVKALEARGFRVGVSAEARETHVEIFGQPLQIALEERTRRTEHARREGEGIFAPRWDYTPTGKLTFRIHEWHARKSRKSWSDGRRGRLERKLNDVVLGLVVVADAKRAWERERAREELARQEAEHRRALAEAERRAEQERLRVLEQQADSWTRSQELRAFIAEVERRANAKGISVDPQTELGQWIVWARQHADRLDPLSRDPEPSRATVTDGNHR